MSSLADALGISDFFRQDHRACDAAWNQLGRRADAGDGPGAARAWRAFAAGLRRHLAMEEEVLFPAFEARTGDTGDTASLRAEHTQIRGILAQMDNAAADGDWDRLQDLGEDLTRLLQHHTMQEEAALYPAADRELMGQWPDLQWQLGRYAR